MFTDGNGTESVPVVAGFMGSLQNWKFAINVENSPDEQNVSFRFSRSVTTKFFSILIITILWCLSLATFVLALTLVLRGRRVEPPTMGYAAALLFAIPAVRNLQPGIPEIGKIRGNTVVRLYCGCDWAILEYWVDWSVYAIPGGKLYCKVQG